MPIVPGTQDEEVKQSDQTPREQVAPAPKPEESFFQRKLVEANQRVVPEKESTTGYLQEWVENEQFRMNLSLDKSEQIPPELAYRAIRVKTVTKLPEALIIRNLVALEKEIQNQDWDRDKFVRNSPIVAKFVADSPAFASMAHNDILKLGNLEELLKLPKELWPMAPEQIERQARDISNKRFQELEDAGAFQRIGDQLAEPFGIAEAFYGPTFRLVKALRQEVELKFMDPEKVREKLFGSELARLREEEEFIAGSEGVGFFESFKARFRENPNFLIPFSSGLVDAQQAEEIYSAAKAVEDGTATTEQNEFLVRWGRLAAASDRRGTTFFGAVADIIKNLPAFAGEFLITGGIYSGAKGAILKGGRTAANRFLKNAVSKAVRNRFLRIGGELGGRTLQTVAATPARQMQNTFENMTPGGQLELEDGRIVYSVNAGTGDAFFPAFPKAWVNSWAEIVSEGLGGTALVKALDRRVNHALYKFFLRKNPGTTPTQFKRFLESAGINGVLGEMGEERVGDMIRFLGGAAPTPAFPLTEGGPGIKELGAEAVAFALFPIAGGVLDRFGPSAEPRDKSNSWFLKSIGENVKEMELRKASPEQIEQVVAESVKGTDIEFVYAPVDSWNQYWLEQKDEQDAPMDPRQVAAEVTGSTAAYDEAVRTGTHILIPMSRYAVTLAPTEHNQFFQSELKTNPGEENPREERERLEEQRPEESVPEKVELGEKAAVSESAPRTEEGEVPPVQPPPAEVTGEAPAAEPAEPAPAAEAPPVVVTQEETSVNQIFNTVVEGLTKANLQQIEGLKDVTPSDIERMAAVISERTRQRARILGVDAFELFREQALGFEAIAGDPSTIEGEAAFQPVERDPFRKRGFSRFRPLGIDIGFLKDADRSTFFHEVGHVWLLELKADAELLSRRPPDQLTPEQRQLLEDSKIVLDFLGIDSWDKLDFDVSEKWAVGTEVYFLEGRAPSTALTRAFRRFRDWITRVYRDLAGLNVTLTDDVRAVMDRLLASQEEIAIAQARQRQDRLFPEPEAVGMTEQQAQDYAETIDEAHSKAEETLATRLMVKLRRKQTQEWKAQRKKVRKQVQEEIESQPQYIALSVLSKGVLPDGVVPDLPSGRVPYKLSRASLVQEYGPEVLAALPRSVWAKEGLTADQAAEDFGFRSGSELIKALNDIFEAERQASPVFQQDAETRQKLGELQEQEAALRSAGEEIARERRITRKELKAGRAALATRLEKALRDQEKGSVAEIEEIFQDIRSRGGIRPSVPTEQLPKRFRAKKGEGVGSDELAQEMFDREVIGHPFSDNLYGWLNSAVNTVRASKERRKNLADEASRLAATQITASIEALIQNVKDQDVLREELKSIRSEKRLVERTLEVRARLENIIDRLTDQRMEALNPDIDTEEQLRQKALESVHNDKQAQVMRMELQILASENFAKLKGLINRVTRPVKSLEVYRKEAEEVIAAKKIREIKPNNYRVAEARSAREARELFLQGNFIEAFRAKEQQLENHELFRSAQKAIDETDAAAKFLKGFEKQLKRQQLGRAGGSYLEQIDKIMDRFEFRRRSNRSLTNTENLREFMEREFENTGRTPFLPDRILNEANRRNFRELKVSELREVRDAVKHIDHLARTKNRLLASKQKREFEAARDEGDASIRDNSTRTITVEPERDLALKETLRKGAAILAMNRKYPSLVRQMDGWKDDGVMWNLLILPMNQAADAEAVMKEDATKKLDDLFNLFTTAENAAMSTKEHIPELGMSLTKSGQIMVALNWGNLDSRMKLMEGLGVTLGQNAPVTEAQVQAVLKKLTEKDWKFVQGIWDFLDTFWPEVKGLAERVDGISPEKVEAEPIITDFGIMKGGYFPLEYDERQDRGAQKNMAEEMADRMMRGVVGRATTKQGHRKRRREGVKKPVKLGFSVIFKHVVEVIHDITHYEYLIDANRILTDSKIESAIKKHYGSVFYEELIQSVRDVAVGDIAAANAYEEGANFLRRGTTTAILGFKLTTALLQPLGLTTSIARIGPKWVWRGITRWMGSAKRMENSVDWIHQKSSFMRLRNKTMTREVSEIRNRLGARSRVLAKLRVPAGTVTKFESAALWMTIKAQMFADVPTWIGAYEKAMEQLRPDRANSEAELKAIEEKAVALADQAVRDTQGSGHIGDMARIQRQTGFISLFTMFSTFFNARWQVAREAIGRADLKSPADVGRLMVDMIVLYPLPAILAVITRELLRGAPDEDDDRLIDTLVTDALLEPLTDIIGVRELVGPLKGFKYKGPAGLKVLGELSDLVDQFGKDEMDEGLWRELNDIGGILFHYPSEQIEATLRGYNAWEEGQAGPGSVFLGPPPRQ